MGFTFGVIKELDFKITLYCFVLVVAFVIAAEYVLGVLEYFLEGSRLYSQMIEKIYKELMLMGMLTFCVMMYEAVPPSEDDEVAHQWLEAIDFSHVYLFFVTFFFVMHAFYLMAKSVSAVSEYRLMFAEKTELMIEGLQKLKSSWWGTFLFNLKMLPFCSMRNHVEFSLTQSLFTKVYRLPEDVDFPYYLSGCFDRFALRTINRSMFTWVVLLFFVFCNFVCIKYNFTGDVFRFVYGLLDIPLTEAEATGLHYSPQDTLFVFAVCGSLLIAYTFILTLISRIYKARLVDRVYPNHSSIDDYIGLLRAKLREQHTPNQQAKAIRIPAPALKKEIEREFDEKEEGEVEDEEGIKFVAELVLSTYKWLKEGCSDTALYIRVCIHDLCCGSSHRGGAHTNLLGSGDTSKRVAEHKAHYVPLKRRLKLTQRERALIAEAGHVSERDGLFNAGAQRNYGSTATDSSFSGNVYHQVPREEEEASSECDAMDRSTRVSRDGPSDRLDWKDQLCCCACCHSDWDQGVDLKTIFLAGKPIWYFRAVELQIMFTCMYMGLWATSFVTMVRQQEELSFAEEVTYQFLMLIPILVSFNRTAYIAETYSLIMAVCELDIEALYDVLVNSEDMAVLASELRKKINDKIKLWAKSDTPTELQSKIFLHLLFVEVDQDSSGAIDKGEFRQMLRELNLSYSDHRFNLLFRAVDSIGGDGMVEEADLVEFMFPTESDPDAHMPDPAEEVDAAARHKGPGTHTHPAAPVSAPKPAPSAAPSAAAAPSSRAPDLPSSASAQQPRYASITSEEVDRLRAGVRASSIAKSDRK